MPVSPRDSGDTRVIAHLDLDCFFVQVEQRKRPELRGKPVAVVQYNPWKGGGLIAVSYEARACGVLRFMRGDDAKKVCPDIELLRAPWADGNAPLNWYRDAGTEVVTVLSRGGVCERASIDEVYLDITEAAAARLLKDFPFTSESLSEEALKTHILGVGKGDANAMATEDWLCRKDAPRCDALLACGAVIVGELRAAVLAETQFTCSAGIAHNKMLAKLTSGMHKPAQQTVIPASYVPTLLATLPLKKIQRLGGKLGKALQEDLGVNSPGDLLPFSQLKLQELYGVNTGAWLWNMARGKNGDEVQCRVLTKSHSCSRAFPGPKALTSMTSVMHWLGELGDRLQEQLDLDFELHNRSAKLLVFHATVLLRGGNQPAKKFPSKSCPLRYGKEKILADTRMLFERGLRDFCPSNPNLSPSKRSKSCSWAVTLLSIGAGDISAIPTGVNPISSFFAAPSRSNTQDGNCSSPSPPTTSATELQPGQHQHQSLEECESGSTSKTPSCNDLEETPDLLSDDIINEEGSVSLQPCSSEDRTSDRNVFPAGDDDVDGGVDLECTPAFGSIGRPVQPKSHFQFFESDALNSIHDGSIRSPYPSENLVIQCSPVEHSIPVPSDASPDVEKGLPYEVEGEKPSETPQSRLPILTESVRVETQGTSPTKPSAAPNLKDLWQRNVSHCGGKRRWEYKEDEIDEEVLAQLPADIQMELRNSLRLNRPQQRTSKRPSISDFFPASK